MKDLGVLFGYCKGCLTPVGYLELGFQCKRCGTDLIEDNIVKEREVKQRQSQRQYDQANISFVCGMKELNKITGKKKDGLAIDS